MCKHFIFALCVLIACFCQAAPPDGASSLRPTQSIPLVGVQGCIDHLAVDSDGTHLYVAALGNNTLEVIDLKAGKQVGRIEGLAKPQGVRVVLSSEQIIVASGDDGKCRKYNAARQLLGTIGGLDDADNVRYDPAAKVAYIGYGEGALAVIDADKFTKLAEIKLGGHPEAFQLEAKGARIFVNVPGAGHVAVIDREKRVVTDKWPIKAAQANFPLALDEAHQRLFVGCRKPAKLLVLDTKTGKTLAALDCCGDTDDLFYDETTKRVYVVGGEGCISVFNQVDADNYKFAEKVATAPGARTALFVPSLHQLFVAVPLRGEQRAEIRVFEAQALKP